jgi:hypothetical protein
MNTPFELLLEALYKGVLQGWPMVCTSPPHAYTTSLGWCAHVVYPYVGMDVVRR